MTRKYAATNSRLWSVVKIVGINAVALALFLVLLETALWALMKNPPNIPGPLRRFYREYHMKYTRNIIQYNADCTRYDPKLFYTLKPGRCRFADLEFDTEVRVNTLGVRDDETSLQSPEIVVLGDSHAMGWGVSEDQAFPAML